MNTSDLSQSISLYPTLSSGSFNLKVNFEKSSELRVEVFNLTGQEVASFNEGKVISNIFHYDLNNLAEGLYTVRIIAGAGTTVRQLQIIK
ncbi:MAG: T9SS type A sorting domain-containing protein [Bacteroidia bacterium]|nr:T9SS type A sorting domain-containing protein [Bacteroidia bacterium]